MTFRPDEVARTVEERLVVAELRRQGGFLADADVVRTALWKFAHHYDIEMTPECFALGQQLELFDGHGEEAAS